MPLTINRRKYEDIVRFPGKFEGEEPWVPYFYDRSLDGDADEYYGLDGAGVYFGIMSIDDDDARYVFKLDDKYTHVLIIEDSMGSVTGRLFESKEDAENTVRRMMERVFDDLMDSLNDEMRAQRSTEDDDAV